VAYALLVLCSVRLLAFARPIGHLVLIEVLRAALVCGGVALTAWLVLRTRTPDGQRVPRFNPGLGRCAIAGLLAGVIIGAPALALGSIPEPTDWPGGVPVMVAMLASLGGLLGVLLGLLFGLAFAAFSLAAFGRTQRGAADGFDGSVTVAASALGLAGAGSALILASVAALDVLGIAMVLLAAVGFAISAKRDRERARWLERVTKGELPGWSIVRQTSAISLPAYVDGAAEGAAEGEGAILAFHAAAEEQGAFRTAPPPPTPVAFIGAPQSAGARLKVRATSYAVYTVLLGLTPLLVLGLCGARNRTPPAWSSSPTLVAHGQTTNLSAAEGVMCARRASDGRLTCWGKKAGALLGAKDVAYRTPEADSRLGPIRTFALGKERACAVREAGDHRAVCWSARDAELGPPIGPPDIVELAVGGTFAVALTADGSVWRWGDDPARMSQVTTPERVQGLSAIAHVAAGHTHALALGRDGTAYCWGGSPSGECGVKESPVSLTRFLDGPYESVAAGSWTSWLRQGGAWRTHGSGFRPSMGSFRNTVVRQYAFSGADACFLSESEDVGCTRGTEAPPNSVFGWGVLEITGNDEGYCARTASDVWCWSGYSLLFSGLG
jgi:hypothetical protein